MYIVTVFKLWLTIQEENVFNLFCFILLCYFSTILKKKNYTQIINLAEIESHRLICLSPIRKIIPSGWKIFATQVSF